MKRIIFITVFCLVTLFMFGCGSTYSYRYKDSSKYQVGEAFFNKSDVKNIEIEWAGNRAEVTTYDGEEVHIYEEIDEDASEKYQLHYYLNNGTLYIEPCASMYRFRYNFKVKKLHVELPTNMEKLDKFKLSLVSASGGISNLSSKDVDIESVSGSLSITDIDCDNIKVESVSGSLSIENITASKLRLNSVSGSVTLKKINADVRMETVSGRIDIYIDEDSSFKIEKIEMVSGRFENEFGTNSQGDNPVSYSIETVSGSVKIHKESIGG